MDFLLLKGTTLVLSLLLLIWVFYLVRKRLLMEQYAFLWIIISSLFIVLSLFHPLMDRVGRFFGIEYGPSALFLFLNSLMLVILIHFSVQLTDYQNKKRIMAQEIALLNERLERLEKELAQHAPPNL